MRDVAISANSSSEYTVQPAARNSCRSLSSKTTAIFVSSQASSRVAYDAMAGHQGIAYDWTWKNAATADIQKVPIGGIYQRLSLAEIHDGCVRSGLTRRHDGLASMLSGQQLHEPRGTLAPVSHGPVSDLKFYDVDADGVSTGCGNRVGRGLDRLGRG